LATIFRTWSYQFPALYNSISLLATAMVGGEKRFHLLPLEQLSLSPEARVLDLCCGGGQATKYLIESFSNVTGLDASPISLKRASKLVPSAHYVEALAENMPFNDSSFDLVHSSVALHEMNTVQLEQIFQQVYRVLAPGGFFVFLDLHSPTNPLVWPGLSLFMSLFETETAWQLLDTDLRKLLELQGFTEIKQKLYAGGALQVIQCQK
jgi:demethylmenaquinone methyltransferase/2-methoxy-6-polyprenyl-1,4-benzoquinol methylase